jgi:hypothetical protein
MNKPTPETYEDINKELADDDIPFEFVIPTQEKIDKWWEAPAPPHASPPQIDMVAEMWEKHNNQTNDKPMKTKNVDRILKELEELRKEVESLRGYIAGINYTKRHE